ncbi:MAG TPA: V-type ATP synthase subunit E family protein [Atribacterota bacterium]|nr:V-type ATP synthase subunit E family protein [Atribacterota bacterium]
MSDAIEDKISLFTKVILERIELDFQKKQNILTENHKNREKNIIADYEDKKKQTIEKNVKDAQIRKQHQILKERTRARLVLLKKKNELMNRVFEEVRNKVRTFLPSAEYSDFLREALEKILTRFSPEQFLYFKFSTHDMENRIEMILNTIDSIRGRNTYKVDADKQLIGGLFVKSGDGLLEIDYTVNTILEESYQIIGEVFSTYLNK